ncbi:MAG: aromatic ring-hydroxylating dioxygenase subunit alpha [Gemmatimonadales bacterium]
MTGFHRTTTTHRTGARTMPGHYYCSAEVFGEEIEKIGLVQWHCVGRSERIAKPGDFFLRTVAGEPLIVVRDRHGAARAHYNLCRHRGTRICERESGHFSETIQCPYHAWTYTTDGRLIGAPHMQEVDGFDKAEHGLHQAAVAEWEGFVFVSLAEEPVPFDEAFAPVAGRFARFGLGQLKIGRRVRYEIAANWKLVFQNYSECLHCPTIHPELSCKLPYQSGANDLTEGPYLGGYMEITEGNESVTESGRFAARPVAPLPAEDLRRAYYYTMMPNLFLSIHPDYVNYYMVWPERPDLTVVESEWLFHPEAFGDPGFNPEDAVAIWDLTNRQDWHITEESQRGIRSRRYAPGPYSARESVPAAWDRAYLEMMGHRSS